MTKGSPVHIMFMRQIVKFSALAKVTQSKYGTIKAPASFELLKNAVVVAKIAIPSITISANAQPGWCIPKKLQDQAMFKAS